jgi:beta-lactamase regulating signal transducer with metallopeptidase domain
MYNFLGKLLLLLFISAPMVVLLLLPTIAISFAAHNLPEPIPLWSGMQRTPLPTAIPSNSSGSSSQNSQSQQTNDNTIANDTITVAGVFAAVVGVILALIALVAAIATGVGIFEVRRIRRFRKQFDKRLKRLDKRIEAELGQLDKRIDTESQKFIEAALKEYITTQRIYVGVESHLRFLLEGTGHSDWMQAVMDIIKTRRES